ncbi:MAG: hypothetical protein K9K33_18315 [Desulfarculaceae bacterium]|nr:hypothetical protein [Desulfarculaceae bacterium]
MGPALWVFLWLWREANLPESEWFGEVRNSRPIRLEEIAGALGITLRTVKRHVSALREAEYLETWSAGHEGLEFMVFLWDPKVEKGDESSTHKASGAKNGTLGIVRQVPKMAPETPDTALPGPKMAPESFSRSSQVPKMAPEHPPTPPHKDLDITRSPSSPGESSYVPAAVRRIKTNAPVETNGEPERGAVVAGHSPETPGLAQARKLLNRVEAWERPDLTRTLTEKLERLEPWQVEQAFEFVWRRHRHRNKGLASPAAWWASMLARAADELAQAGP